MIDKNLLYTLAEFNYNNPNIYIGGSISLILLEIIPSRIPGDIDIISPNKIQMLNIFENVKHPLARRCNSSGFKWELFNNSKAGYLEYEFEGSIIKLSPPDEVFEWKQRKNTQKHIQDLKYK